MRTLRFGSMRKSLVGDSGIEFIDEQAIEGDVIEQIDLALAFITCNTRQTFRFTG